MIKRLFAGFTATERLMMISCLFSLMMLTARIVLTGNEIFLFLPWNLFLAFIPYAIVRWLMANPQWVENKVSLIAAVLLWLLFIPNSFYILTDLFHLKLTPDAPRWFDLTMIFSFAWNGMLAGILAIRKMEIVFRVFLKKQNVFFFLYPVMWLIALGIYIGRYMRFNSWDVITNPFALIGDVAEMFINPFQYTYAWGMIFCFSIFLTLVYLTIKRISFSLSEINF